MAKLGISLEPDERTDEEYPVKIDRRIVGVDLIILTPVVIKKASGAVALAQHIFQTPPGTTPEGQAIVSQPTEYRALIWSSLPAAVKAMNGRRASP